MREISRSFQIDKQVKKMCADCTVRTVCTDADVAGSYDMWQVWLAVVWMSWHMTRGLFVANGMATRGPINGHHVSPKHWLKLV
jgi:hypothetical protein